METGELFDLDTLANFAQYLRTSSTISEMGVVELPWGKYQKEPIKELNFPLGLLKPTRFY